MHNLYIIKDQEPPPPSSRDYCLYHSSSDGMCTLEPGGCKNCPGKEWLAEKKAQANEDRRQFFSEFWNDITDGVLIACILGLFILCVGTIAAQGIENGHSYNIAQEVQ